MRFRLRLFDPADVCVFDDVVTATERAVPSAPEGVVLVVESADPAYLATRACYEAQSDQQLRAAWEPVA